MKQFAILFTALLVSYIGYSCFKENNVPPVYSEIPDVNFKACLKSIVPLAFTPDNKFISNHPSVISYNEMMSVRGRNITSLSGIEYFTSLTGLDCPGNKLSSLDISKNTALTELFCGGNQLTTLDVSKNTSLKVLNCYNNQITTLNLGNNEVLKRVICSNNQLITLDVSKNSSLIRLECDNNKLKTLDISKNTNLSWLYIDLPIKCSHPSIKAFKDRGGNLMTSYISSIPPFTCP